MGSMPLEVKLVCILVFLVSRILGFVENRKLNDRFLFVKYSTRGLVFSSSKYSQNTASTVVPDVVIQFYLKTKIFEYSCDFSKSKSETL